jgi:hypothetical protein
MNNEYPRNMSMHQRNIFSDLTKMKRVEKKLSQLEQKVDELDRISQLSQIGDMDQVYPP